MEGVQGLGQQGWEVRWFPVWWARYRAVAQTLRYEPQSSKRLPPLHVGVGDTQSLVKLFQLPVEAFVRLVLPLGARLVAEEHPAPERAEGVYAAEFRHLKGAARS